MPQLVPFYFINEVSFSFAIIGITVYIFSKYILPRFIRLFLSRIFISKVHSLKSISSNHLIAEEKLAEIKIKNKNELFKPFYYIFLFITGLWLVIIYHKYFNLEKKSKWY